MSEKRPSSHSQPVETNPYHWWAARFWHGMPLGVWLRLLWRHRFAVSLARWPMAAAITLVAPLNSLAKVLQYLLLGRLIARTEIKDAPIFIIGHWRSGTTLLHELMVLDGRYGYPTTYECFAPNHFLISSWLITKLKFLLPARRPMDNMAAGWDRPQEDEFALCNMGIPSPYRSMAFCNHPPEDTDYLDFRGVSPAEKARWQAGLRWFLQRVTFRCHQRIILKSPPHTARIRVLLELFPDAKFVHIVRDPRSIFPSTVRLWKSLHKIQSLQEPRGRGVEEYVFSCFERMYEAFEEQRRLIPAEQFFEIRYEDLIQDPLRGMMSLYEQLKLGEFETVRPRLEKYLADSRDYRVNSHQLEPSVEKEIHRRWGRFMRKYGYCQSEPSEITPTWSAAQGVSP